MRRNRDASTWSSERLALLALGSGIALRLTTRLAGHGRDVDAWVLVAHIMGRGETVYAETHRYNYGPVWFTILAALGDLTQGFGDPDRALRVAITLFLIGVDVAIFSVALRFFGLRAAALFFLSPISIITTAYLGQFDNLAVLIGLAAVLLLRESEHAGDGRRKLAGLVLLGLSLMTKHVFFLFPLWLAFKERTWTGKLRTLTLPVAIFLAGFLPYWEAGREGIVQHVFLYGSSGTSPFWDPLHAALPFDLPRRPAFFLTMALLGVVFRKQGPVESLLFYTACLIVFSSGWYSHYLAIPVLFVACYMNPLLALFTVTVTLDFASRFLPLPVLADVSVPAEQRLPVQAALLLLGSVWASYGQRVRSGGGRAAGERGSEITTDAVAGGTDGDGSCRKTN